MTKVLIKKLDHGLNLPLPKQQTPHSAGFDLYAAVEKDIIIQPGERHLIPCGFSMAMPEGYEAQIRPRSGLAYKNGITVLNTPGTIDADYRGEVCILLINLGQEAFTVTNSLRIAQMVISEVVSSIKMENAEVLPTSVRNTGGFGSTGTT